MTIRVRFKFFCPICGTEVFIITADCEVRHCSECDMDFVRGDLKIEKEIDYNA